jgi:dihydroorotate dehydrogenase (NAD+) catalytic subunit
MTTSSIDLADFDYSTDLGGRRIPNPILTASGTAGSGKELSQFFPLEELGAIVTKSIMLKPRSGRATPRMAETPSGMLNSIGLQGPGIDIFLENDVPWLASQGARVIISIAGETIEDYAVLARKLRAVPGITALEVNISCPNVENRGQVFACNPETARDAIAAVRRNIGGELPIFAKLSPDVTDIAEIAREVVGAGADGLALINTILGMVIDTNTMFPKLSQRTGGLSGPAVRPVAVRAIYQVHAALPDVPIIGMGGVSNGRDAFELVLAGASAISVGTATFGNPRAAIDIKQELAQILVDKAFATFNQAIGFAHREEIRS